MDEHSVESAIAAAKAAAHELQRSILKSNQLPDGFPNDYISGLLSHIDEIEGADEESIRLATHLRDKILQTIEVYKSDDDLGATGFLNNLHNDLFVKISRFLRVADAAQRYPQFEDHKGRSFVRSDENEEERQRLVAEANSALKKAKRAEAQVQQFIHQNGLINIGTINFDGIKLDLELTLIKARKAITSLVLELNSHLIDLAWLSEFMHFVSRCGDAIAVAVKRMDSQFRSSAMVKAIQGFLTETTSLIAGLHSLVRRARPPEQVPADRDSRRADRGKMGVEPGQRYRARDEFGQLWEISWEVDALVKKDYDVSRIFALVGGRRQGDNKVIGVSVLRDGRFYELVKK